MVHLTRIYTRTGDRGTTRLVDNSLVAKTDLRVEAYGTVDELNSAIGVTLSLGELRRSMIDTLRLIQNELFDLGSDLATPLQPDAATEPLRIIASSVDRLEGWCDEYMAGLEELRSFVLPGGTPAAAHLHVCRTICRRAERIAWHASEEFGLDTAGGVSSLAVTYLNRLSDLLFILARAANRRDGDVLWVPGGSRQAPPSQHAE
ncbi:MAG TPA: cob(I)yrinic acid a,c-diamide adenosyltransferase [Propionibacteriaceae bacterium]|nr:cob(I)yrinic acid a,c-diamide adenosyltransferase [Propionibacteriaceae bacterium]